MKRKLGIDLPAWYRWSDGRELSRDELKKMRFLRKRTQRKGESWQAWFMRVRYPIERYEAAQKAIRERKPSLIQRVRGWLAGRSLGTMLELKR